MARNRMKAQTQGNLAEVEIDAGADELATIEALLDQEDAEIPLDDETVEAVAVEIEAEGLREGAYAQQTSEFEIDTIDTGVAGAAKVKKARAPKAGFKEGVMAMFANTPCVLDSDEGELTADQLAAIVDGVRQVKVQDKVSNLLAATLAGTKPSVYTDIALGVVAKAFEQGVEVTGKALRDAYLAKGYKDGTANAQAGQMMSMFPALKIASRPERGRLKPNPASVILDVYRSL